MSVPDAQQLKVDSIMEAASALTTLNEGTNRCTDDGKVLRQFLHESIEKNSSAPTFPQKLMALLAYADTKKQDFCVKWQEDGKSFVIFDPKDFTDKVVPLFFKPTKFSSFTRKLYRWGFRQISKGLGPKEPIVFGSPHFQRDNADLLLHMKSVTAVTSKRKTAASPSATATSENSYLPPPGVAPSHAQAAKPADRFSAQPQRISLSSVMYAPSMSAMMMSSPSFSSVPSSYRGGMPDAYRLFHSQQPYMYAQHFDINYPMAQTTAEIVNAAIAALQHSR